MKHLGINGLTHLWDRITEKLDEKIDKVDGKGLSTNDYTNDDKVKLQGIEEGANKIVVDNEITETSRNPVESRRIYEKFEDIQTQIDTNAVAITNDEIDAIWNSLSFSRYVRYTPVAAEKISYVENGYCQTYRFSSDEGFILSNPVIVDGNTGLNDYLNACVGAYYVEDNIIWQATSFDGNVGYPVVKAVDACYGPCEDGKYYLIKAADSVAFNQSLENPIQPGELVELFAAEYGHWEYTVVNKTTSEVIASGQAYTDGIFADFYMPKSDVVVTIKATEGPDPGDAGDYYVYKASGSADFKDKNWDELIDSERLYESGSCVWLGAVDESVDYAISVTHANSGEPVELIYSSASDVEFEMPPNDVIVNFTRMN